MIKPHIYKSNTTKKSIAVAAIVVIAAVFIISVIAAAVTRASNERVSFSDGFETDTSAWAGSGTVTRVAGGTNEIAAPGGGFYGIVNANGTSGPNTQLGGYNSTWPGDWRTSVDVYLDPAWEVDEGFTYSVAVNNAEGANRRDYVFHAGVLQDESTDNQKVLALLADTEAAPVDDPTRQFDLRPTSRRGQVTQAGWYTIQHEFRNLDGRLVVDVSLLNSNKTKVFSQLIDTKTATFGGIDDLIPANVGGNRYGWFTNVSVEGGVAVDNVTRINTSNVYTVDEDSTTPVTIALEDGETITLLGVEDGEVTVGSDITITNETTGATIVIPAGTEISATDPSWDGVIIAPTAREIEDKTVDGRAVVVAAAVQVGSTTTPLQFSQPVKVVLPGQAGKNAGYLSHDDVFTPISVQCNAQNPATTLSGDVNECYTTEDEDLIIWTNHFSTYVAYTLGVGAPNTGIAQQSSVLYIAAAVGVLGLIAIAARQVYAISNQTKK